MNNWSTLGDLDQRSVSFMTRQRNQCDRPFNVAMPQVEDSTKTMLNAMRIGYDLATTPNLIFEYARGNFLNMEERWESHEYVRGDYMPHIDWELEENDTAVWVPIVTKCYTEINTKKRQGDVTTLIMAEDILFHIKPAKGYNDFLSIRALQDYDWAIFPKGTEVSYDDLENEELMKSQYWTDARMEYVGEGAFDFTFKSPTDFQTVRLYLKTGGNEKQIDRKCRAIETEYKEALEVERAKIDGKNNMAKEYWSYFLNYSKYFMQGSESCLSLNKWIIYFEENRDVMQTRYEQLSTCTGGCDLWNYARNRTVPPPPPVFIDDTNIQSLRLNGFGVFNCDQLQRLGNTVEMFASYETTDGEDIIPMVLYVVDYNINGVLSFSPSVVKMNHKSKTALLVIDRRQNYYLMTSDKVAEIQEKAPIEQNFQMEDITAQVISPNGLRSVLGLKAL